MSIFIAGACSEAKACTSAIVAASANPYGRPLLWKNRDTSAIDNKVEYVPSSDGAYAYVALFNADDRRLEQAWIGMNEVGFAVMNTASYNIKNDQVPDSRMDREGFLMTVALRSCRTVDDFRRLLDSYPRPMGVEANFGVIDATGAGGYFETNNDSYVFFDLADAYANIKFGARRCIVCIGADVAEWHSQHQVEFAEKMRGAEPAPISCSTAGGFNYAPHRDKGIQIETCRQS